LNYINYRICGKPRKNGRLKMPCLGQEHNVEGLKNDRLKMPCLGQEHNVEGLNELEGY